MLIELWLLICILVYNHFTNKVLYFSITLLVMFNMEIHQVLMLCKILFPLVSNVVTLTLGSQPRQGLAKVQAKSEARESHFMFARV
jgi:hypothetical protein